ncbi:hypothetical protein GIB67_025293 [Kingdonia uniflora]|uniref:Methyltransferase small domain-containing protein n=1 Tax=Kingdonia uniflora TaxID=39325 RepID=A0A7J7NBE9_9MAGN|nr:hypothetical protein GIB67_025293 [Kingdonia uniflora]
MRMEQGLPVLFLAQTDQLQLVKSQLNISKPHLKNIPLPSDSTLLKMKMKLKQLEGLLGNLDQFSNPKLELEQYPTGAHIASRMLYTAENSFGDISEKVVADFGCGCGTLGLAAALLGAEHVIGIDVDSQSLEIAAVNAEELEVDMDFVQCDINNFEWRGNYVSLFFYLSSSI